MADALAALLLGAMALVSGGTAAAPADTLAPLAQWRLPKGLAEVSGLAVTADGVVLAHDDERAVVYELDLARQAIGRRWVFRRDGKPVRGDFEGIAVRGQEVWLLTSDGQLFHGSLDSGAAAAAEPPLPLQLQEIDTGLAAECEFEGLAVRAEQLVLACKRRHDGAAGARLLLWNPERRQVTARIDLDGPPLHVSAIEWCPRQLRFVGLAAREGLLFVADERGRVETRVRLDRAVHPQPEGLTFAGGDLLLADEGKRRARLSRYAWPPCR